MIAAQGWSTVFGQALAGVTLTNSVRGFFNLQDVNIFASFRLIVTAVTAGNITGKLRFGFQDADAQVAVDGLDFAAVAAVNASSFRTVVYDLGAVAPQVQGNPLAILPPRVCVIVSTAAGTTLTYRIDAAMLYVP